MFHIVFVPDSVRTVEFDNTLLISIATKGFHWNSMWHGQNKQPIHYTDKYSQHHSNIWPILLNGWVLVYELSHCEFCFRCNFFISLRFFSIPVLFGNKDTDWPQVTVPSISIPNISTFLFFFGIPKSSINRKSTMH